MRHLRLLSVLLALSLAACAHESSLVSDDGIIDPVVASSAPEQTPSDAPTSPSATGMDTQTPETQTDFNFQAQLPQEDLQDNGSIIPEEVHPAESLVLDPEEEVVEAKLDAVQKRLQDDFGDIAKQSSVAQLEGEHTRATSQVARTKAKSPQNPPMKNRYYVVRTGDTAEFVSKMIFGSSKHAQELVRWNGPVAKWVPGTVLFYVSPKAPHDRKMVSFYEERGLNSQRVTVRPGDSLGSIARNLLGSEGSAKELALVNGIRDSEPLHPGQLLQVYPSPLLVMEAPKSATKSQSIAHADPVGASNKTVTPAPEAPIPVKPLDLKPAPTVLQAADAPRGPVVITLAPPNPDANKKTSLASTVIAALFHHHPLVLACSLAVLLLLGYFFYLQRRRVRDFIDF